MEKVKDTRKTNELWFRLSVKRVNAIFDGYTVTGPGVQCDTFNPQTNYQIVTYE